MSTIHTLSFLSSFTENKHILQHVHPRGEKEMFEQGCNSEEQDSAVTFPWENPQKHVSESEAVSVLEPFL